MNRPFSAFASLMALLALAMLAVSSTTRSTSVKPAGKLRASGQRAPASRSAGALRGQGKLTTGGTQLPANKIIPIAVTQRVDVELKALPTTNKDRRQAIQSVSVVVAQRIMLDTRPRSLVDCLSHYDPFYDRTVYGVSQTTMTDIAHSRESAANESVNLEGDLDTIFHDLLTRPSTPSLPAGAGNRSRPGRWPALVAAVQAWVKHQMLPPASRGASSGIEWKEYVDFAAHPAALTAASRAKFSVSGDEAHVRSGDPMRHSAALSLYGMSVALRIAADELERFSGPMLPGENK